MLFGSFYLRATGASGKLHGSGFGPGNIAGPYELTAVSPLCRRVTASTEELIDV
jgi:hypothetical protein